MSDRYNMKDAFELSGMPVDRQTYIYYLIRNDIVVYVGKSKNYIQRMWTHQKDETKDFNYFCLANPDESLTPSECEFIEIAKYLPIYNKVMPSVDFVARLSQMTGGGSEGVRSAFGEDFDLSEPDFLFPLGGNIRKFWARSGYEYQNKLLLAAINGQLNGPVSAEDVEKSLAGHGEYNIPVSEFMKGGE